jgi:hypothetical protein
MSLNIESNKHEFIRIKPHLSCIEGIKASAIVGMGIILGSEGDLAKEINNGQLQKTLPIYLLPIANKVALWDSK